MKYILLSFLLSQGVFANHRLPKNIASYFKKFQGCFVLKNIKNKEISIYNKSFCDERHEPNSTFKIPNSLIGLESEEINQKTIFKWDGKKQFLKDWEQDHDLASAIKVSCVPCYQQLARKIGHKRMQSFLDKFDYGNKNIGKEIDMFWLKGPLKISAFEQIAFLEKFYLDKLPISKKNSDFVKNIIFQNDLDGKKISGKTGSMFKDGKAIRGWFVGYVQKSDNEYVFVTKIRGSDKTTGNDAKKISYKIIEAMNL